MSYMAKAAAMAHKDEGFGFYFADERKPDVAPIFRDLGGEAHAKMYCELAVSKDMDVKPWEYTCVRGEGYVDFRTSVGAIPRIEENS